MEGLEEVVNKLNISKIETSTTDADARRIAIAFTNLAIEKEKINTVISAPFLERDIYEQVLDMKLRCDQLDFEKTMRRGPGKTYNPLKLSFESKNKLIQRSYGITKEIVKHLESLGEKKDEHEYRGRAKKMASKRVGRTSKQRSRTKRDTTPSK